MRRSNRWRRMAVLALLAALCAGCGGSDDPKNGNGPAPGEKLAKGDNGQLPPEVKPEEKPAPPPTIPEVVLDQALKATCLVGVGETRPEGQLPDLAGVPQPLKGQFGEKLTVVVFWNKDSLQAQMELQDLGKDVLAAFADKGVSVVTVNVGNTAEEVRQTLELTGAKLPVLLDADGAFFAKVASERLPRTYVVDADGKILWFDVEYSESTSRGMIQTIQVALGELGGP